MNCVGITDGSAGMVSQVESLAIALGIDVEMRVIKLPAYIKFLPNRVFDFLPFLFTLVPLDTADMQTETLLISCGRKAALLSSAVRRRNPAIKNIHIQDPQMSARSFDLIVAMEHDKITGSNVIKTRFALHRVNEKNLKVAELKFAPLFAAYPKPHIAVLLGGSTNKYTFDEAGMRSVIDQLKEKLVATSGSLLITASRRTGAENTELLKQEFFGNKRVYIYDGVSENPYMGLLAIAGEIMVSNDSVNMMSEAAATGKKLSIIELPGHCGTKPSRFAEFIKTGHNGGYQEMSKLAEDIKIRLGML